MIASGFYSSTSPQLQTSDRKVRDRYLRSITRPIKRSASQFIQKPLVGESFRVTCYARVQITYSRVGSERMHVDFVIVTALEEERDAVLSKLPSPRKLPPTEDDVRVYFHSELPVVFADVVRPPIA